MYTYKGSLEAKWQILKLHSPDWTCLLNGLHLCATLKERMATNPELKQVHHMFYLSDVWYGETCPNTSRGETLELAEYCISGETQAFDEAAKILQCPQKTWQQMTNLKSVLYVFTTPPPSVTVSLICHLHQLLMKNLLPMSQCGHYRIKDARPSGSNMFYFARPNTISDRLQCLVDFVNDHLPTLTTPIDRIKMASFFMSQFLLIHPFANGNGRLARILLSILLTDTFVVPIAFTWNSRNNYIAALEHGDTEAPTQLVDFVIQQAYYFACNLHYATMQIE